MPPTVQTCRWFSVLVVCLAGFGCTQSDSPIFDNEPQGQALGSGSTRQSLIDRFNQLNLSINQGDGYSKSTNSADLAWAESYILSGYLAMYQGTGNTSYLDAFVTHADRILANATDSVEGLIDGYKGWVTPQYSINLARNLSFSGRGSSTPITGYAMSDPVPFDAIDTNDPTLPAYWTRWQGSSTTLYRDATAGYGGTPGVVVKTNGVTWQVLQTALRNERTGANYDPGSKYEVFFHGRTGDPAAVGRFEIYDYTDKKVIALRTFSNTNWQLLTLTFVTPTSAGHDVRVRLYHNQYTPPNDVAYFDNISVRRYGEHIVHEGLVTAALAEFAFLVAKDPMLVTYVPQSTAYSDFIQNNTLPKWESLYRTVAPGLGTYVFADNDTGGAWARNSLPHNQYLALGRTYVWMYRLTGNAAFQTRALALGATWKSFVELQNNGMAYRWRYDNNPVLPGDTIPTQGGNASEDASHGNIDIRFAMDAQRAGLVYTLSDMAKFVSTFQDVMWNGNWTSPGIYKTVGGLGDLSYSTYLGGWAELARYENSQAWEISDGIYRGLNLWTKGPSALLTLSQLVQWHSVVNPSFQLPETTDTTLPQGWSRTNATAATASRDCANGYSGCGATITTNPAVGWQVLEQKLLHYPPSTTGTLAAMVRTNGSAAGGRIQVYNATTATTLAERFFTNTTWAAVSVPFTFPANGTDVVKIRLYTKAWNVSNGQAFFDDISVE